MSLIAVSFQSARRGRMVALVVVALAQFSRAGPQDAVLDAEARINRPPVSLEGTPAMTDSGTVGCTQFTLRPVGFGWIEIQQVTSGLLLDAGTIPGGMVAFRIRNGTPGQFWRFATLPGGDYQVASQSGLALTSVPSPTHRFRSGSLAIYPGPGPRAAVGHHLRRRQSIERGLHPSRREGAATPERRRPSLNTDFHSTPPGPPGDGREEAADGRVTAAETHLSRRRNADLFQRPRSRTMSVDLVPMPARGICRAHVGIPALWVAYPGLAAALEEDTDPATSGGLDELDRLGLVSDPGRSEAIETGPFARSVPAGSRLGLGR